MAEIFKTVNGRKMEKAIALNEGVQDWMDEYIFEAGVRAEEDLANHFAEGHSFIEIEQGDVDRYLILNDERGQKAAMSIEFGRQASEVENEDGTVTKISAMEGLFILHKAVGLKGRKKPKVKLKRGDLE